MFIGASLGCIVIGKLSDAIGRKKSMLICDLIFLLGSCLCAFSPFYWTLVIGRFVVGIGVGFASLLIPLLMAEISPLKTRGTFGLMSQFYVAVRKNIEIIFIHSFFLKYKRLEFFLHI